MIRIQKIVSSREYTEFRDLVILLESSFAQITKNGDGIQQVQLAITPKELIIASYEVPAKIVELEDNNNDEVLQLVSIIPLECVQISIYSRRHNKLKIRFCNGSVKYYELSERENASALWRCWCDRIQFLNSDSNMSSLSESSLIDYIRNSQNTMTGACTSRRKERPTAGSDRNNEISKKMNSHVKNSDILAKIHTLLDENQESSSEDIGVPVKKDLVRSLLGVSESTNDVPEMPKKPVFHSVPRFASGVSERCKNRLSLGEFRYPRRKKNSSEIDGRYQVQRTSSIPRQLTSGNVESETSIANNDSSESLKLYSRWNKRIISGSDAKYDKTDCKIIVEEDLNLYPAASVCHSNKEFVEFLINKLCPKERKTCQKMPSKRSESPKMQKKSPTKVTNVPPDSCLRWVKKKQKKRIPVSNELDESYVEWLCNRRARHIEYACNMSQLRQKMKIWKTERENAVFSESQKHAIEVADQIVVKWEACTIGKRIPKGEYIIPYGTVLVGLIELQCKSTGKLTRIRKVRSEVNLFNFTDKMCYLKDHGLSRGVFLHSVSLPNIKLPEKQGGGISLFQTNLYDKKKLLEIEDDVKFWFLPLDLNFSYQDLWNKQCHYHKKLAYLRLLRKFHEAKLSPITPVCISEESLKLSKEKISEEITEQTSVESSECEEKLIREKQQEDLGISEEEMSEDEEETEDEDDQLFHSPSSLTTSTAFPYSPSSTIFLSPCYCLENEDDKKSPTVISAFLNKTSDLIQKSLSSLKSLPEKFERKRLGKLKSLGSQRIRAGESKASKPDPERTSSVDTLSELAIRVIESQQKRPTNLRATTPVTTTESMSGIISEEIESLPKVPVITKMSPFTTKQIIPTSISYDYVDERAKRQMEADKKKKISPIPFTKQAVPTSLWCDYVTQRAEEKKLLGKEEKTSPIPLIETTYEKSKEKKMIPYTKQAVPTSVWCDYVNQRAEEKRQVEEKKKIVQPAPETIAVPPLVTRQVIPTSVWCKYVTERAEEKQRCKQQAKLKSSVSPTEILSTVVTEEEPPKRTALVTKQLVPANVWCKFVTQQAEERQRRCDEWKAKKKFEKRETKALKKGKKALTDGKKAIMRFRRQKKKNLKIQTTCFSPPLGSLKQFGSEAVAKELTLIDREFLFQIEEAELEYFLQHSYTIEDYAPHIKAMIIWYDRILSLTISEILKERNTLDQAKTIRKCIQIVDHMISMQSLNSSHAILSALQSFQLGNLKNSWEVVYNDFDKDYKKFYAISKNYLTGKSFRLISTFEYRKPSPPYLPFFGELLEASLGLLHFEKSKVDFRNFREDKATYPVPRCTLEIMAEEWRQERATPFVLNFENPKFFCGKNKTDLTKVNAIQAHKRIINVPHPPKDLFLIWQNMRKAASEYKFSSKSKIRRYLLFEPYQHLIQSFSKSWYTTCCR